MIANRRFVMSLNRMSGCESHWLAGSQWHPVSQRAPVLLLALALALSGCGHDSAPSDSGASPAGGKAAAEAAPSLDPDTPDGAIRLVIAGMQEKRPEALWNFLPASYQKDLNDLVHHFARSSRRKSSRLY
jgi:hypothetical protein